MAGDVRLSARVRPVVKNGVAKENDVSCRWRVHACKQLDRNRPILCLTCALYAAPARSFFGCGPDPERVPAAGIVAEDHRSGRRCAGAECAVDLRVIGTIGRTRTEPEARTRIRRSWIRWRPNDEIQVGECIHAGTAVEVVAKTD